MSCTGRTAIADNAENRFIWEISCVLKVFALGTLNFIISSKKQHNYCQSYCCLYHNIFILLHDHKSFFEYDPEQPARFPLFSFLYNLHNTTALKNAPELLPVRSNLYQMA